MNGLQHKLSHALQSVALDHWHTCHLQLAACAKPCMFERGFPVKAGQRGHHLILATFHVMRLNTGQKTNSAAAMQGKLLAMANPHAIARPWLLRHSPAHALSLQQLGQKLTGVPVTALLRKALGRTGPRPGSGLSHERWYELWQSPYLLTRLLSTMFHLMLLHPLQGQHIASPFLHLPSKAACPQMPGWYAARTNVILDFAGDVAVTKQV